MKRCGKASEFNRRLIESSLDCIKVLDLDGNLLSMNSGGQRLLEIDDLSLYLNCPWIEFWQGDDQSAVQEAIAAARNGGKGTFQACSPSQKGKPMWWDVVITPIRDAQGAPERLLAISRDITEQKLAQETILNGQQKIQEIIESIRDSFFEVDRGWRLTYVNSQSAQNGGANPEDLIGKNIWALYPGMLNSPLERVYRQVMQDRQPAYIETQGIVSGTWYGTHVYPSKDGITVYAVDITERKRVEEALKISEQKERARAAELSALMDTVPAIIWISRDAQANEVIGNRSGYEFLRMNPGVNISESAPEEALKQQPYRSFINGEEVPRDELPIQVASATGKAARNYAFDMVFQDGSTYHLIGNVNPILDDEGKPCGAVGAFIDITELRRLQAEQIEAKAQIEAQQHLMEFSENTRQAIARDIHDGPIQTLASITFNIQMIKEAYADAALRAEMEQINATVRTAVRELREIVNDLRPPALIRFGLASAIRMHTEDMRERYPDLNIALKLSGDETPLPDQTCLALFRIYQEALNNIVHHAEAKNVQVAYQTDLKQFTFELRDDGKGFSVPRDLNQLASAGHFGLVGMRERALSIGGKFRMTSKPGEGTTLTVTGNLA